MSRRRILGSAAAGTLGLSASATSAPIAEATPARTRQPAPSGTYRIDLHAHFLPPDYRAALLDHGHFTIGGYPTPDWSPEQALAFMDYYGGSRSEWQDYSHIYRCRPKLRTAVLPAMSAGSDESAAEFADRIRVIMQIEPDNQTRNRRIVLG
ncbi:hypothetical protein OHB12_09575 [Nocardia sp. NBC_01730]|uniref:hypothetical protein n=1 Tax=Nocardia sp. NBC_01730 TaxID=2975998 RepID=UPI002E160DE1|nr:hypothetical protein OHB12_09575 [Nocardia sp. NBC_01730]